MRMPTVQVECPECRARLRLQQQATSARVHCPKCDAVFRMKVKRPPRRRDDDFRDDRDYEPPQRPARGRHRSRGSKRALIIGLSIGGGVLLLTVILLIVFLVGFGKDPKSAASMNDGSPITIYNPRFRRTGRNGMTLLVDYKRNEKSRRRGYIVDIEGTRSDNDGWQYTGKVPVSGRRFSDRSGTFRVPVMIASADRTYEVKIVLRDGLTRMSNYLPVTIPRRDEDLPRD